MKRVFPLIVCCVLLSLPISIHAAELITVDSGICTNVVDSTPIGMAEAFSRGVEKLFCFTRVVGPYLEEKGQHVVHVWYYQNTERARITLPVRSSNWRTYSTKNIQPYEVGDWRVEVLDPEDEVISVFQFFVRD